MAWVPLAESDAAFTFEFTANAGTVAVVDSSIVATAAEAPTFGLEFTSGAQQVRLTFSSYLAVDPVGGDPSGQAKVQFFDGAAFTPVVNQTPGSVFGNFPVESFTPSPIDETGVIAVVYNGYTFPEWSSVETFSILVEVFADGPEPPPEPVDPATPYRIRNQFRHLMGTDSGFTAWVRDEEGKFDMQGLTLEVSIQRGSNELFKVPAVSTEPGRVDFGITAAQAKSRLDRLSKFRLYVQATYPDETTRTLATGILEVVG